MSYLQGSGIVKTDLNRTVVFLLQQSRMLLMYVYFFYAYVTSIYLYNFLKNIKKVFPKNSAKDFDFSL